MSAARRHPRPAVRYVVRDGQGRELVVPSLEALQALHRQGFLGDDDEVRQESATTWVRAATLLGGEAGRRRRRDGRWIVTALFAAVALVAALALLLSGRAAR